MPTKEHLLNRLDDISKSIQKSENALALLALGSCGLEQSRLDEYSDLDFFVIVKDGFKKYFIDHLDWLENVAPIAFRYKNTVDGHKVLFNDGIFCEFAVFETNELINIPFSTGKIIWKSKEFDTLHCIPRNLPSYNSQEEEWLLGEILTTLYVGLCRYKRGEKLSAFSLIQDKAIDRLIRLKQLTLNQNKDIDIFNPRRRFEKTFPELTTELGSFMQGYEKTIDSAHYILKYVNENYRINKKMKLMIEEIICHSK